MSASVLCEGREDRTVLPGFLCWRWKCAAQAQAASLERQPGALLGDGHGDGELGDALEDARAAMLEGAAGDVEADRQYVPPQAKAKT